VLSDLRVTGGLVVNELAKANDRDAKLIVVVVSPLVALMEDQVKDAERFR